MLNIPRVVDQHRLSEVTRVNISGSARFEKIPVLINFHKNAERLGQKKCFNEFDNEDDYATMCLNCTIWYKFLFSSALLSVRFQEKILRTVNI